MYICVDVAEGAPVDAAEVGLVVPVEDGGGRAIVDDLHEQHK